MLKIVKMTLRYLKRIVDYVLGYQEEDIGLREYTDADWDNDMDERKSTYGYVFLLSNRTISWLVRNKHA